MSTSEAVIAIKRALKELHGQKRNTDFALARLEREERAAIRQGAKEKSNGGEDTTRGHRSGASRSGRRDDGDRRADDDARPTAPRESTEEDDTIAYVDAATIPKRRVVRRQDLHSAPAPSPSNRAAPRLMSAVVVVSSSAADKEDASANDDSNPNADRSDGPAFMDIAPRPVQNLSTDIKQRGKRMFGALLGHLNKARSKLTTDEETPAAKRKRVVEERVEKKLSDIDQVVIEGVKKKFQEQKRAERARKLELLREIAAKQAELLQTVNVEHYNSLTHFILTKAEPRVFWLPREHTEATLTMVEESAAEMRAKGQTIVIEPEPVDEKQLAQMDAEAEDGDHQHTANGHGGDAESKSAAQNSNDNTGAGGAESPARDGDNHANAHPAEDADGAAGDTAKVDEDAMEM